MKERELLRSDKAKLRQELEAAGAQLRAAEEGARAARREGQQAAEDLERERQEAAQLRKVRGLRLRGSCLRGCSQTAAPGQGRAGALRAEPRHDFTPSGKLRVLLRGAGRVGLRGGCGTLCQLAGRTLTRTAYIPHTNSLSLRAAGAARGAGGAARGAAAAGRRRCRAAPAGAPGGGRPAAAGGGRGAAAGGERGALPGRLAGRGRLWERDLVCKGLWEGFMLCGWWPGCVWVGGAPGWGG